jgi:RNA polymerase sigma-70 factor, ECF subfamily
MDVNAHDLFVRYAEAVYRYFLRLTGRADLAADLTQEVFLRIVRGLGRYEARGREAAWVFRIAHSVIAAHYRRSPKPVEVPLSEAGTVAYEPDRLLAMGFEDALGLLSKTDRQVYLLREQGGLDYEEIGVLCGLTKPAVRSRLCRARDLIRRRLGGRVSTKSDD